MKRKRKSGKLAALTRLRHLPRYMRDKAVPRLKKFGVLVMIAWVISPVDAVPELFLPVAGFLDDIGVLAILIGWMYGELAGYESSGDEGYRAE